MDNKTKTNTKDNAIAKTWISGKKSVTMIIDRSLAEEYDLLDPQHVILEKNPRGILIRKIDVV